MSTVHNGPIEFRSVKAMDEYIKGNAEPIMSEHPCKCGEPKEYGHRLCQQCKAKNRRQSWTKQKRRKRASKVSYSYGLRLSK